MCTTHTVSVVEFALIELLTRVNEKVFFLLEKVNFYSVLKVKLGGLIAQL